MSKRIQQLCSMALVACLTVWGASAFAAQQPAPRAPLAKAAVAPRAVAQRVNINTANAETLANMLNGIGIKKAQAIVAFRQKNGPFKSLAELGQVKGIGDATLKKNASVITLR